LTRLGDLLPGRGLPPSLEEIPVGGLSCDSRTIVPGTVFFAVPAAVGPRISGGASLKFECWAFWYSVVAAY